MKKIEKEIYLDCARAMLLPVILYTAGDLMKGFLTVFTADQLGGFADAVFTGNLTLGLSQIKQLVWFLLLTVILAPGITLLGHITMIRQACTHVRLILGHFLDKSVQEAMKIKEGEAHSRLDTDANDLRIYWVLIWEKVIEILILFPLVFFSSVRIHAGFTIIVIVVSFIKLTVPLVVNKLEAKYDKQTREYKAEVRSHELEMTTQPHMIKLFGMSETMIEKLNRLYQVFYQGIFRKSVACTTIANQSLAFLNTLCLLVILFIGSIMVSKGTLTAGAVAAMMGYFTVYNTIMEDIGFMIRNYRIVGVNVQRLKLLYEEPEEPSGTSVEMFSGITGNKVTFSYEERTVFQNVSFQIVKGEKVAICGTNGSGKSTLLKVITRLTKGYEGSLKVSDQELRSIAPENWRKMFAYVTQDPYLFRGTVHENVWLGNQKAAEDEVKRVLEKTGIGYLGDRMISADRNELSGGEKQKISIARAILKNTSVLFLDEPGNHLDVETLEWLKKFIQESDKTIVYVSHDEELSALADKRICL